MRILKKKSKGVVATEYLFLLCGIALPVGAAICSLGYQIQQCYWREAAVIACMSYSNYGLYSNNQNCFYGARGGRQGGGGMRGIAGGGSQGGGMRGVSTYSSGLNFGQTTVGLARA